MLDMNFQKVIIELQKPSTSKDACGFVGMCPHQHSVITQQMSSQLNITLPGACWACQWAFEKVLNMVVSNASDAVVIGLFQKVCQSVIPFGYYCHPSRLS